MYKRTFFHTGKVRFIFSIVSFQSHYLKITLLLPINNVKTIETLPFSTKSAKYFINIMVF